MGLISRRPGRLESGIGIFLLAILLLIGLGVFIKQSDFDMGRFGINTVALVLSAQGSKIGTEEKPSFDLPVPSGFKKLSEAETYVPENLYEKIDGKATLYIESGFVKLFTQRFVSPVRNVISNGVGENDDSLWFELFVYDMAAVRNAFSVYSVQKRADVEALPAMQFGYRTGNALYFVHDKYYVELVGSSESADLLKAMSDLADKLTPAPVFRQENAGVGKVTEIPELTLFPQENLVPGSAKLYLSDVFGFDGLSDTFVCQYRAGDESITAFLSKRPSPQDARTVTESYYNFLVDNGGKDKLASDKNLQTIKCKVLDFYDTTEIIFAIGPYVAGIHEAKNQQSAEKLAAELFDKLNKIARTTKND